MTTYPCNTDKIFTLTKKISTFAGVDPGKCDCFST